MVVACDVSNKIEVLKMAKDVLSVHDVDILVNNAGIGILGDVANQSIGDMESVTKTNYFGMIYCTKAFLDPMLRKKNGHIVMSHHWQQALVAWVGCIADHNFYVGFSESYERNCMEGVHVTV